MTGASCEAAFSCSSPTDVTAAKPMTLKLRGHRMSGVPSALGRPVIRFPFHFLEGESNGCSVFRLFSHKKKCVGMLHDKYSIVGKAALAFSAASSLVFSAASSLAFSDASSLAFSAASSLVFSAASSLAFSAASFLIWASHPP
jgi:hypothetical protein